MKNKNMSIKATYRDSKKAYIPNIEKYIKLYNESISDLDKFWDKQATRLDWIKKWSITSNNNYKEGRINWFLNGQINATYNCIDRHVENGFGNKIAIIWESNDPSKNKSITYSELLKQVCLFSNVLKFNGIGKGDRVCIYMQMIPELAIAMLACARVGAIHSIVFGAFSSDSLKERINDSQCKLLVTQDTGIRGNKVNIPMKKNADLALEHTPSIEKVIVVKRTRKKVFMKKNRDFWWHESLEGMDNYCKPETMNSEDPLFILYTSGSTGKPKGIVHTTAGYMVYTSFTHKIIFDYQPGDIYWCTADIGWITGHSYIIYGPLSNGATTLMFEGVPNYPTYGRFWQIVEKYKVNTFYTAPTALRALMREGNKHVTKWDLSSLKILGTVGEPIKAPEWNWYYKIIGNEKCPIIDTWWQTETGGILIAPIPSATPLKPGSATLPCFGIEPVILDESGNEVTRNGVEGLLFIKQSWPGQMRTIYGDHQRFIDTYFKKYPGYYFTGDGAKRDDGGYYWITGRVDDILNVSGHRLGTAEIEGAIGQHDSVAEAAVVGYPHEIKGQGIYAYVTLMNGVKANNDLLSGIKEKVKELIGPHASLDKVQFTSELPKTRSGKIMRRILRKIAHNETKKLGDISTLSDPNIVKKIISEKVNNE